MPKQPADLAYERSRLAADRTLTAVVRNLPLCKLGIFGVGLNGFYWKQFTADTGSGARFGSFETFQTGVGPVVSYISPKFCGNHMVVAEVKYLPQIDTSKTLRGDYLWFKAALAF
ncbi:MAG: transporter [Syntrophobacteraceae bacterium]|nr:transporter [Syntrophobacteraceae bacterium]